MELDYIFSHAAPASVVRDYRVFLCELGLDESALDHTSENWLEVLKNELKFDQWWFGHYHQDIRLDEHFVCLYQNFREVI